MTVPEEPRSNKSSVGSRCWAADVSPCEGGLSREDVFTRGLWPNKTVSVWGFPFLKGETRAMSVDALTVKCLCRKHNSDLSVTDEAAIDAFIKGMAKHRHPERETDPPLV